ncbi:MAG TPA: CSLREA domain-containing protein [Chloroflexota bacterium]|nr:CSLREA domain-containing protein [Chloroflexota bacterium]
MSFVVTTTADAAQSGAPSGNCTTALGQCTLRAAIQAANFLGGGPHLIQLQAPGTYLLDTTNLGALPGINNVTLGIQNVSGSSIAIDGNHAVRVFDIGPTTAAQVTITGLTIQNGAAAAGGLGGGVRVGSGSTLVLTNTTVSGNAADGTGGGLFNAGTATLTNTTFSGNAAAGGGGLYNAATVTLTSTTLSGNSAGSGGGLYNSGTATLTNTTFSGNAASFGGGLFNNGTATLTNTTFSGNAAASGGGGLLNNGTTTLQSSIIAQSR